MRVHTVASIALAGMGLTSALVWSLAPANADSSAATLAAEPPVSGESPAGAATADPSQFTAGATLLLEGRLGHGRVAQDRAQSSFVLATITGANDARATAVPLDLVIVIDTSGSMRGSRLVNAIEGARGMVRRLRDQDSVAVVTYSRGAELLVPPTIVDSFNRERVIQTLSSVEPMGDTCISCGLDMAMAHARVRSDRVSRILLLSDGEATSGVRDENGFVRLSQRAQAMGTTISTIGVDVEYNDVVMSAIARFSNGAHYFVENPSALGPVFDQEFESLTRTVANDVELTVELADGVQIERVFDRDAQVTGNRIVVPFGTVAPGEQKTFLLGVRIPATRDDEQPVARMSLRYADLVRSVPGQCDGALAARTTTVTSELSELDPFVATRISRSQTVEAFREANELSRRGQFDAARQRLDRRAREVRAESAVARRAPRPAAPMLQRDFDMQERALGAGGGGFRPGQSAAQERSNSEVMNPFSM